VTDEEAVHPFQTSIEFHWDQAEKAWYVTAWANRGGVRDLATARRLQWRDPLDHAHLKQLVQAIADEFDSWNGLSRESDPPRLDEESG